MGGPTWREVVLSLNLPKVVSQIAQHLVLRLLLAHHGRHQLAQVAHDEDVDLRRTHALDELVHLRKTT